MKRLLKNNCKLTLAINYVDFGTYDLIVNHQDFFGESMVKLNAHTSDIDLINRIKYSEDNDNVIAATKEAMLLVFAENRKCCMEIKHQIVNYSTEYWFEDTIHNSAYVAFKNYVLNN